MSACCQAPRDWRAAEASRSALEVCTRLLVGISMITQRVTVAAIKITLSRVMSFSASNHAAIALAYGNKKDSTLHTSGFSGLGESCAVAIETLNLMFEENLLGRAADRGAYLRGKLEMLQKKHPKTILEVRGKGLFQGIRLNFQQSLADKVLDSSNNELFKTYQTVLIGALFRELYERHNILVHFQPGALDILHFIPPLIIEESQIDTLIAALDDTLTRGLAENTINFVGKNIKRVLSIPSKSGLVESRQS